MVEERSLCVDQIQNFPEDLHEHTKPSLLVEDEKDEQSCSQSQHVEKSVVCNEELDYKERGKGSQINASFNLSHSEISSQEEGFCLLDSIGEKNDISVEAFKEGESLNSRILNEVIDISFENSHVNSF